MQGFKRRDAAAALGRAMPAPFRRVSVRPTHLGRWLLGASGAAAVAAACGGNPQAVVGTPGGAGEPGASSAGAGAGPLGEGGAGFELSLAGAAASDGGAENQAELLVTSSADTLDVDGTP